jgi:hypothetical protein
MTERRKLKQKLSKLKYALRSLPRLIDCSMVYGDYHYTEQDTENIKKEIELVEQQIKDIDGAVQT